MNTRQLESPRSRTLGDIEAGKSLAIAALALAALMLACHEQGSAATLNYGPCNWKDVQKEQAALASLGTVVDLEHADADYNATLGPYSSSAERNAARHELLNNMAARLQYASLSGSLEDCANSPGAPASWPPWRLRLGAIWAALRVASVTSTSSWSEPFQARIFNLYYAVIEDSAAPASTRSKSRSSAIDLCVFTALDVPSDSRRRICQQAIADRIRHDESPSNRPLKTLPTVSATPRPASTQSVAPCGEQDAPASAFNIPQPQYPTSLASGFSPTVTVKIHLSAAGRPENVELVRPSGNADIDKDALRVAANADFIAKIENCHAVESDTLLNIEYHP